MGSSISDSDGCKALPIRGMYFFIEGVKEWYHWQKNVNVQKLREQTEDACMRRKVYLLHAFYKHDVYKHTEAQILGSQKWKTPKKLSISKGSLGQEKHF